MFKQKLKKYGLVVVSFLVCTLSLVVFIALLTFSTSAQKEALASSYTSEQIIIAVNRERQRKNLSHLTINHKLMNAATKKAEDMSAKQYFSHISPVDGTKWSDFIKQEKYEYVIAGENLANGFDTVDTMVEAWMNSPSHRENILNKEVVETGIGISVGKLNEKPTIFVAQMFGKEHSTSSVQNIIETKEVVKPTPQSESIGDYLTRQ